jgi:hypothetical protein
MTVQTVAVARSEEMDLPVAIVERSRNALVFYFGVAFDGERLKHSKRFKADSVEMLDVFRFPDGSKLCKKDGWTSFLIRLSSSIYSTSSHLVDRNGDLSSDHTPVSNCKTRANLSSKQTHLGCYPIYHSTVLS